MRKTEEKRILIDTVTACGLKVSHGSDIQEQHDAYPYLYLSYYVSSYVIWDIDIAKSKVLMSDLCRYSLSQLFVKCFALFIGLQCLLLYSQSE